MNNSTSVMDWTYESVMSSLMRDLSSSPPTLPESVSSETQRFTCLVIEKENSPIASQELKRLSQSMRDTYMDASCESSSSDSAQTNCNSSLLNDQHLPTPLTIHPNDAGAVDGGEIADVKCFKSECYYCQITSPESIRATRLDFIQNSTKSKTTTFIGSESDKALFSNELIKLVQALKDTKITSLNLSGNDIDCDLLIDLAQYLSSTQIKTLDLSENRIGHKGFEYFNEILKETKISSLNVSKNSVGQFFACKNNSSSVEHSSECSHAKIFENSASTYLDLSHSSNSVDLKCIASILKNSKIKHLNLYRSIQSSESFGLFVRYLVDSSLTVLNLSGCKIGNNGVKILASVLKNTKIRSLDLSGNHIRCEGLNVFAPCLIDSQITYLNLSENRVDSIDGLGINSLALVLPNTKITKLDINYFSNVRNWKILSNCLAHTKITSLGFKGMVPKVYDDIKSLADGVKNSQINSIILGSNDAVKIVQLLSLCVVGSQLTSLTLSRFKINCSVMESLVIALKDSNITSIKLEHNSIKCKVMEVFVSYLVSSKVTNLHLSNGRKLGIGAVECLALSLRNTQISSLNLSSNQLDCESLKVLAPCLVGTKITNLNLEKNDVDLCMENYDDDESDYDDEDYYYYMDDYYYYYDNENDNSDDEDYDHFNDLTEGNRIDYMKEGMRSTVGVECLALAMKKSQLKSLNLCNNGLTCKSLLNIVLSLQDTKITTLNLRGNELCCNVLYLANILRNTQISSLDLGWKLEDNKMDSIHSKLSHSDSSLNLERQMRCTFASYYLSRINQVQTQKITSLTLSQSQISCCGDLKELCQFLSNSQVLSLDLSNNRINCDSIYYLAQVLQSTKISSLNLASNEISTKGIKHLALRLPGSQLTSLHLSYNLITDESIEYLSKILVNTNITHLNLSGNQIGRQAVDHLCESVAEINVQFDMPNLDFSHINLFKYPGCFMEIYQTSSIKGIDYVVDNVFDKIGIKKVYIHSKYEGNTFLSSDAIDYHFNNNVTEIELIKDSLFPYSIFKNICQLKINGIQTEHVYGKKEEVIELRLQNIENISLKELRKFYFRNIMYLNLSNNNIEDVKFKSLVATLKFNCMNQNNILISLNLSNNKLGVKSAELLAEILEYIPSLTYIDLYGNNIGYSGFESLMSVVDKTNLCWLSLGDNNIEDQLQEEIELSPYIVPRKGDEIPVALQVRYLFSQLVSLNSFSGELEFTIPKTDSNPPVNITHYPKLIKFYSRFENNAKYINVHVYDNYYNKNKKHDWRLLEKITKFGNDMNKRFLSFIASNLPKLEQTFGYDSFVLLVKECECLELNECVESLLLHRVLYYVDEENEILHPFIYMMMHKYGMPLYCERIEPNKREQIISYFQNHPEIEGTQTVIELLVSQHKKLKSI